MKKDTSFNLINIDEAAKMLGASTDTLRRWDKNGTLPAIRLATNGKRKYKRDQLEKFINAK